VRFKTIAPIITIQSSSAAYLLMRGDQKPHGANHFQSAG
jgi:hypothetical protein